MHKILSFVSLFCVICILAGCHKEDENKQDNTNLDLSTIPGMVTHDVSMLVSDSGKIKYHATAPVWYRYDLDKRNPYQYFPEGLVLDQIDQQKNVVSHIQADTAYNYENTDLWHLINNVKIYNVQGERFTTNDLYWDARNHTVYSDSFIHIERNYDILEGYGFTSNDNFTEYEIRQTTGIFEVKEEDRRNQEEEGMEDDSLQTTETAPAPDNSVPAPQPAAAQPNIPAAPSSAPKQPQQQDLQNAEPQPGPAQLSKPTPIKR